MTRPSVELHTKFSNMKIFPFGQMGKARDFGLCLLFFLGLNWPLTRAHTSLTGSYSRALRSIITGPVIQAYSFYLTESGATSLPPRLHYVSTMSMTSADIICDTVSDLQASVSLSWPMIRANTWRYVMWLTF